jgi:hypothetical protein
MGGAGDYDLADRAELVSIAIRVTPAFVVLAAALEGKAYATGTIGGLVFFILLLLDIPLGLLVAWLIWRGTELAATGFTKTVYAGGNIPRPRGFSREAALVMQGRADEAAQAYRDHLAADPADNEARLRLAELELRTRNDPAAAERAWLDARLHPLTAGQETAISNGLIDLYLRTGRRDRLKVELARFADRHAGSRAGAEAARRLRELKEEDAAASG